MAPSLRACLRPSLRPSFSGGLYRSPTSRRSSGSIYPPTAALARIVARSVATHMNRGRPAANADAAQHRSQRGRLLHDQSADSRAYFFLHYFSRAAWVKRGVCLTNHASLLSVPHHETRRTRVHVLSQPDSLVCGSEKMAHLAARHGQNLVASVNGKRLTNSAESAALAGNGMPMQQTPKKKNAARVHDARRVNTQFDRIRRDSASMLSHHCWWRPRASVQMARDTARQTRA